ncbi:hypothetical protein [Neobacillus drentensis]
MMSPDNVQKALDRVVSFCSGVVRLEGRPSDEAIEVCERILELIKEELK